MFQSSAARRSRCNLPCLVVEDRDVRFQSSAARRSRCNVVVSDPVGLTRFQSSAARRSRCNGKRSRRIGRKEGFNPQRLVGAAATRVAPKAMQVAWFQSSAARRSRCNLRGRRAADGLSPVSILSGSSEPLQRHSRQPARAGDLRFNPQRLVGAAATDRQPRDLVARRVSILSGSSEPLQQPRADRRARPVRRFNPQRLVGAAATPAPSPAWATSCSFNPQRLVGAAATSPGRLQQLVDHPFQSSAARRSRCNHRLLQPAGCESVSILSGSSEPLQLGPADDEFTPNGVSILSGSSEPLQLGPADDEFTPNGVSILSGSSEPLQRRPRPARTVSSPSFNPQRLVGAAATRSPRPRTLAPVRFQSSAARRSRCNAFSPPPRPLLALGFQSSAARRSRCNLLDQADVLGRDRVSILSGSSEPLQPAGCRPSAAGPCFNPQRLVGAAATQEIGLLPEQVHVSILSGSSEPLQPFPGSSHLRGIPVSILSGSSEPLQHSNGSCICRQRKRFNPQRLVGAAATVQLCASTR